MAITQRYKSILNGRIIMTGNTLLIYQVDTLAGGPFTTVDTSLQLPQYPEGTTTDWTQNSSMAVLTLPAGARVAHAELTWTSLLISGPHDYSAFKDDPITFITPSGSTTVAPQFGDTVSDIYTRSADVTALVQAAGSGEYTVGRVAAVNGFESNPYTGNAAGWYLSVVIEMATEPNRLMQINVGNEFVPGLSTIDFSISGFSTPTTGQVTGKLFTGIQRGDPQQDVISIYTGPTVGSLNYQLTRPPLPDNNMFIGIISNTETNEIIDTSGTFGNNNNMLVPPTAMNLARWHMDIASFDISPSLTNNQTSLVTRSVSEAQIAVINYNVYNLQIEAQAPIVSSTKTVDYAEIAEGKTLTYTITVNNTGEMSADDVTVIETLPEGLTFVPDSVYIDGVLTPGANIETGINVGSIAPTNGTVTLTFQALVTSIPTENPINNIATVNYTFIPLPGQPPFDGSTQTTIATTLIVSELYQVITDLIQSVALEQTALSHILNAEGEKIQKAVSDPEIYDVLAINKSVVKMVKSISILETVLQSKLATALEC